MCEFKRPKLPDFRRMTREQISEFIGRFSGVFFAIPLNGEFGFGRVVRRGVVACHDLKSSALLPLEDIDRAPVLFFAGCVMQAVMGGRRWKILGKKPLSGVLVEPVKFFREDIFTGAVDIRCEGQFRPYGGEDLSTLERLILWSPTGIEDRLRNHFAGRPDPNAIAAKYDPEEHRKERKELRKHLAAGASLRESVVQFLNLTTERSLRKFASRAAGVPAQRT